MAIEINTIYRDMAYQPKLTQSGDVQVVENAIAVKQAIMTILNTPVGTRLFEPDFGCDIRRFIFEFLDPQTAADIKETVRGSLARFEPRVVILGVEVYQLSDVDGYGIDVTYRLKEVNITDNVVVSVQRL